MAGLGAAQGSKTARALALALVRPIRPVRMPQERRPGPAVCPSMAVCGSILGVLCAGVGGNFRDGADPKVQTITGYH